MSLRSIASRLRVPTALMVAALILLLVIVAALLAPWVGFTSTAASTLSAEAMPTPRLTAVAEFPAGSFLENFTIRADGSMLITELKHKQLWYLPPPVAGALVRPLLLHTFDQPPFDIVEPRPDEFYVDASDYLASHHSYLLHLDLRGWQPGEPVRITPVLEFPFPVSAVNGAAVLSPNVMLVADSLLGLIWRVDLSSGTARVWLKDSSMNLNPFSRLKAPQPGINGLGYAARTHYLYYTSTAQRLFMRVPVDPTTLDPSGGPELVARGSTWDDFDIDEKAGVAYVSTHRENSIEKIALDGSSERQTVIGSPFDERLVGPSRFAWGRGAGEYGSLAYVATDGGVTEPPADGIVRPAMVLRMQLG